VTTAFCGVLVARELARIAEADVAQKQRHLDETTRRHALGTATDYDVLAAQVALDNARPSVIRSANRVRLAREQLRFLLAEASPVEARGELAVPVVAAPTCQDALALVNRPELGELAAQASIYGELVTIARAANKPRLDFSGSWGRRSLALKTLSSDGTLWTAGLFATVPLFDGCARRARSPRPAPISPGSTWTSADRSRRHRLTGRTAPVPLGEGFGWGARRASRSRTRRRACSQRA
jgi:outer membrane protein